MKIKILGMMLRFLLFLIFTFWQQIADFNLFKIQYLEEL